MGRNRVAEQPQSGQQPRVAGVRPVTAVIVGAGHRSLIYASYALQHPDRFRIVGIVDPDEVRRRRTAEIHGFAPEFCFASIERLIGVPPIADAVINGTMDALHVETTLPLLQAGYEVLLEKPIGISEAEVLRLLEAARYYNRTVMICHVLRYAPFYNEMRRRVAAGEIGDILTIQSAENVSYHHMAMGFVRGKWRNMEHGKSSMLMAKCCHDLDLLAWMKSGIAPVQVSSFGGLTYFREQNAPEGSGLRCLDDCRIEETCFYSARKHYVEQRLWRSYVMPNEFMGLVPTDEEKLESLRRSNPYGRCVWRCDNDVVDHQSVIVQFADGSTATHNMVGGSAKGFREIHLVGAKGEIQGVMEDGFFVVRKPDARAGHEYSEEKVVFAEADDMHGGGDLRLVEDFVRVVRREATSLASTSIEDSIYGHLIGFAADRSMKEGMRQTILSLS